MTTVYQGNRVIVLESGIIDYLQAQQDTVNEKIAT